jgi:hypothetical protein
MRFVSVFADNRGLVFRSNAERPSFSQEIVFDAVDQASLAG